MIERITSRPRTPARVVMFDFDGTIGLIRAGWMPLMLDTMMETLGPLTDDPAAERARAQDYVARLTGRDTLQQMEAFAAHAASLGARARSGAEYKAEFMSRIERKRSVRLAGLEDGSIAPDRLLVPGSVAILEALRLEGITVYLASGSAHDDICREAKSLGIERFFAGIFGSAPGRPTKRQLLARIVAEGVSGQTIPGESILTFGDGRTELEETREVGGTAVGVASNEPDCLEADPDKRRWLIDAGADYIIPNYLQAGLMDVVRGIA